MKLKDNPCTWNQVMYMVSDVYSLTRKLSADTSGHLGSRMRNAAVAVSAGLNTMNEGAEPYNRHPEIFALLSSLSILETYLLISKDYLGGKDIDELIEKLGKLKENIEKWK